MAEWIVGGEAPADLWDVDIRRFAPFKGNGQVLAERTGETLGLHYAMRWPRQELQTARPSVAPRCMTGWPPSRRGFRLEEGLGTAATSSPMRPRRAA